MDEKQMTVREQILWYLDKIVDKLTEQQAQAILAMLNRFYLGKKEE